MPTPEPVRRGAPVSEIGYAGLGPIAPWSNIANDVLGQDDDIPELTWPNNIRVWHQMRSDAQLEALTLAYTLPIRRMKWTIRPNGARDEAVEKVASDFGLPVHGTDVNPGRRRHRFNHDDHLRHALLAAVYGHMFFEQFGEIDDDLDWRLRKLAPRMPQSLAKITVDPDGGLASIQQFGTGIAGAKPIPVSRLAAYVWDREGANWAGRSIYRSCYRHWLLKDRLLRVDAMKNERYGLGIPFGKAPKGANAHQIAEHGRLVQSIKADPDGGVGMAAGAEVGIEGIKGALPDTLASIRYQDEAMARKFLAMFMQLGSTETGSRALGDTFVNFFQLACEAEATWYLMNTNEYVIEDMIDWNFGPDENAPLIGWEVDEDEQPLAISDLVALIDKGIIVVDDELKSWARDRWNMPQPTEAPGAGVAATRERIRVRRAEARTQTLDRPTGHRERTPNEVAAAFDPDTMQEAWVAATNELVDSWSDIQAEQIDALVTSIADSVRSANPTTLATVAAPVMGSDVIGDHMMTVAEDAVTGARAEALAQGVEIPLFNMAELEPFIRARAEAMAVLMARGLSEVAVRQALNRYGAETLDPDDVADGVRAHLEELSDTYLDDQLGGALTQAQNSGRMAIMSQRPATIYASELLDSNTCSQCSAVDGRKYDSIKAAERDYPSGGFSECLGGPRCRGTLVAVYDEAPATVQ